MQITAGNAWLNARAAFLPFGGVVGVGYGPKLKAGKVVAHLAIVVPLLEITDPRDASLTVPIGPRQRRTLRLLGVVVSNIRGGRERALYHVSEEIGNRVLGGVSLQVNV